ncbi:MAG: hypothetical protein K9L68_11595, partial [Spirochaetales bacterium]|nr:hypothetical protein [Spirochaetales bacterium]MCF7939232.1 hypothetical protein [Spirochaetales bacterium]
MQNQVPGNIENLTGDRPRGLGLSFLLTLRAFGDMGLSGAAGPANRSHLASVLSVPERSIIGCRQTHSRRVAAVDVPGEEAAGSGSVAGCTGG